MMVVAGLGMVHLSFLDGRERWMLRQRGINNRCDTIIDRRT